MAPEERLRPRAASKKEVNSRTRQRSVTFDGNTHHAVHQFEGDRAALLCSTLLYSTPLHTTPLTGPGQNYRGGSGRSRISGNSVGLILPWWMLSAARREPTGAWPLRCFKNKRMICMVYCFGDGMNCMVIAASRISPGLTAAVLEAAGVVAAELRKLVRMGTTWSSGKREFELVNNSRHGLTTE